MAGYDDAKAMADLIASGGLPEAQAIRCADQRLIDALKALLAAYSDDFCDDDACGCACSTARLAARAVLSDLEGIT